MSLYLVCPFGLLSRCTTSSNSSSMLSIIVEIGLTIHHVLSQEFNSVIGYVSRKFRVRIFWKIYFFFECALEEENSQKLGQFVSFSLKVPRKLPTLVVLIPKLSVEPHTGWELKENSSNLKGRRKATELQLETVSARISAPACCSQGSCVGLFCLLTCF
jgi:hypothetical protein